MFVYQKKVKKNQMSESSFFDDVMKACGNCLKSVTGLLTMPKIDSQKVTNLISQVESIFQNEGQLLHLQGNFVIVGDIHGYILDFYRIIEKFGRPPETNYLFLGDLIDKGNFGFETVFCIYYLKSQFPKNVFIIRGNHEFEEVCSTYGFKSEMNSLFPKTSLFEEFVDSFSYMPFAAVINGSYLCVHGGIGPNVKTLDDISKISLPLHHLYDGIPEEIIWSDPATNVKTFSPSPRSAGYRYGSDAVKEFLDQNNLKAIIRGHMTIMEGTKVDFDGLVYTVHTASNCEGIGNSSGALEIKEGEEKPVVHVFPPNQKIPKRLTATARATRDTKFAQRQGSLPPVSQRLMQPGSFTGIRLSIGKISLPQSPNQGKVVFG